MHCCRRPLVHCCAEVGVGRASCEEEPAQPLATTVACMHLSSPPLSLPAGDAQRLACSRTSSETSVCIAMPATRQLPGSWGAKITTTAVVQVVDGTPYVLDWSAHGRQIVAQRVHVASDGTEISLQQRQGTHDDRHRRPRGL